MRITDLAVGQSAKTQYFTPGRDCDITRTGLTTFFVTGVRKVRSIVQGQGLIDQAFAETFTLSAQEIEELQTIHPSPSNQISPTDLPF
jgi:hypothetical protein